MINISKSGNAIKFAFTDSDHYLYGNGEIECPVNSLSLIADNSNMITFRKANSNDIFLSFDPANSNLSDRESVIDFYKTNMVGSTGGGGSESGITSGDVQTMIDASLDDYYTDDEVDAALSGKASASDVAALQNEVAAKADTSAVTAVASDVSTLSGQVATKVNTTDFNAYSAATDARIAEDEEVTAAALNDLQENKADTSAVTQSLSAKQDALEYYTENEIEDSESGQSDKYGQIEISDELNGAHVYVDFISSDEEKSPYASIDAWVNDGEGNEKQNRVYADADGVGISADENADDGEGNIVHTTSNVSVSSTEIGMNVGEEGDTSTTLLITSTSATLNGDAIATEPYVGAALSGKADTSAVTAVANDVSTLSGAVDNAKAYYISFATIATTGIRDEDWDGIVAAIDDHRPIYAGYPRNDGGILYYGVECMNKNVSNTQIVLTSSDDNSHYFYTFTKNGSNDYTFTSETRPYVTDAEKTAWNAKAEPYSAGTGIEISGNVISATGGGGATYSAGTNISIDTANTINCTLNLSNGTGNRSIQGLQSNAGGENSIAIGTNANTSREASVAMGGGTKAQLKYESAFGFNNISNLATIIGFGNSGNTLMSIGNGTSTSARHNAFEIRQNGDIYFPDTDNTTYSNYYQKPMVRLQDMYAALGGLKFVQCTQAEYDALVSGGTVDSSTIYFITNVVS